MADFNDNIEDTFDNLDDKAHELKGRAEQKAEDIADNE
jgi:hypothetical protein